MVKARQMQSRTRSGRRYGQAIIETALAVIFVLLPLLLGMIQYGMINNATATMTQLAREGARFAALHANDNGVDAVTGTTDSPDDKIRNHIQKATSGTSIPWVDIKDNIVITPSIGSRTPPPGSTATIDITVTITYPLKNKFFIPASFPGLSQLQSYTTSGTMVIEQ